MSLSVSKGVVMDAAKELKEAWKRAREVWDDDAARRFESDFLEPLAPQIRAAVQAMDSLAEENQRAERDCRDD